MPIKATTLAENPRFKRAVEQDPQFAAEFYKLQCMHDILAGGFIAGLLTAEQLSSVTGLAPEQAGEWARAMAASAPDLLDQMIRNGLTLADLNERIINDHNGRTAMLAALMVESGVAAQVDMGEDDDRPRRKRKRPPPPPAALRHFMGSGIDPDGSAS